MTGTALTRRAAVRALAAPAASTLPVTFSACRREEDRPTGKPAFPVALLPCADYGPAALAKALTDGWAATAPPEVRGKRVVIKPNIADFSPDRPIHTDARLVEALILHLRGAGAGEVVVAEGPPHNRDTEWLFRQTGYEDLARRLGVPLVDLNHDDVRPVRNANPRAKALRDLYLPDSVLSADVIVSVAKLKTHRFAGITLSLKNMFGIVPGMKYGWPKNVLHWNGIPLSICEVNATVRTRYSVVDGVVGMEGYGPILGTAKRAGVLVMGPNALAVDAVAARVMGVDPARVDYLAMAQTIGLGSLRPEDIRLTGARLDDVRTDFVLPPGFSALRATPHG
jgi:uncharacterized protein (DUF362 family)